MPSPTCQVKDGAGAYVSTTNGVNVTPGNTITIKLTDSSANSWVPSCLTADELSDAATITAALTIDPLANTATFVAPVAGRAYRFQSRVNGGNGPDGKAKSSYTTTFCVYTLNAGGDRCIAPDETVEGNATAGWVAPVNGVIRRQMSAAAFTTLQANVTAAVAYALANPQPIALLTDFTCTTSASGGATSLSLSVAANEIWEIEFDGTISCSSTGGVKFALVGPASSTAEGDIQGEGATNINTFSAIRITDTATYVGAFSAVAATLEPVRGYARVKMGATPGAVVLSARPVTNTQTATLKAGFIMRARKVTEV